MAERLVELFSRVRVFDCETQAGFGRASATRAERRPPEIEHCQCDLQPFAHFPENIFLRHFHVTQGEPRGRRAANSHFLHARLDHLETWHVWSY